VPLFQTYFEFDGAPVHEAYAGRLLVELDAQRARKLD